MENKDTLDTLSNTLQALTQATQALTVAATQMMQTMQGMAGGVPPSRRAQPAQINTWEDDPFSEAVPTTNPVSPATVSVNVPDLNAQPLPVRIVVVPCSAWMCCAAESSRKTRNGVPSRSASRRALTSAGVDTASAYGS